MPVDPTAFAHEPLLVRPPIGRVFDAQRTVRLADSAPDGRLRLDATARYLQDIANDDSRNAGSPNSTAWVARRTVIHVDRFPRYLDRVALSTWCSGIGSRWAERRYSVAGLGPGSTENGGVEAATLWVHVDLRTMRPVAVPNGFAEHFGVAALGRSVSARLHLPTRAPPGATVIIAPWPLRFVDFDVLGHVNNSVYWAMVEEEIERTGSADSPLTVTLEHHAPVGPSDAVTVTVSPTAVGFDMWIEVGAAGPAGRIAAVVRATRSATSTRISEEFTSASTGRRPPFRYRSHPTPML